jgi:hypothetical protein
VQFHDALIFKAREGSGQSFSSAWQGGEKINEMEAMKVPAYLKG